MKFKKEYVIGIVVLVTFALTMVVYQYVKNLKNREDFASQVVSLSPSGGPPETIEGLRNAIAAYERQIDAHVRDAAQTGVYWKLLAIRLQDRNLHNLVLDALERAIYYNPSDPLLYHMTGVSAGYIAKNYLEFFSRDDNSERQRLFALAESGYLRAIDIDGDYSKPRYGIGVLYVFELDRPADAIPHLERLLVSAASDTDAMFVLARAYYETSAFQRAIDIYDKIMQISREDGKRRQAWNNKQQILELING